MKLCDLVDELIGPISCDESIQVHNVRMAVRDVRDSIRTGHFVNQGEICAERRQRDLFARKGRTA
jgi:hypothetical protein